MPKFVDLYVSLALEYGIPIFVYRPNPERLRQAGLGHFWDGLEPQLRRLDEAGFPVLDHILTKTSDQPPDRKEAYVRDLFANVRPGLSHFLIHPTTVSEEVATVTENVESRLKDYELFRDRSMAGLLEELGIHTTTYRHIREAYIDQERSRASDAGHRRPPLQALSVWPAQPAEVRAQVR